MHAHAARISFRTRCPLRLHSHAVFSRLQCPRTQLILLCFGVWPGLLTVRGRNEWSSVPITVAAPHLGLLEAFWMMAAGMPRPIALEPYTKIPVVGTIFRAAKGIAVPLPKADSVASKPMTPPVAISRTRGARMSREENGLVPAKEEPNPKRSGGSAATTAVRQAIARHKQTWAKGGEAAAGKPIAIMPEGTTHNGHSLIKFFSGAFEGAAAPCSRSYSRTRSAASTMPTSAARSRTTCGCSSRRRGCAWTCASCRCVIRHRRRVRTPTCTLRTCGRRWRGPEDCRSPSTPPRT